MTYKENAYTKAATKMEKWGEKAFKSVKKK
jgi:hypothetical protein